MRTNSGPERVEREVVALAERQSGVIGYRQLRALGLSASWIKKRVAWGWLIPVLHGVYAVGHRPRLLRGWHHAALLAAGPRSALSNRSAGAHWVMTKAPSRPHVIAPRSADGIKGSWCTGHGRWRRTTSSRTKD
jgi:putative AbiEi antitoxin of type IV toxin-antitoxin system